MSKPSPRPAAPPATSNPFLAYLVIGLVFGAVFGATITWMVMRRQAAPAAAPMAASADPSSHVPAPDLTAGQSPAEAARTLGNFYYDHQNWAQAVQSYEAAIRQGNDDADIRTDLGNAYRFSGRADAALAQYQLAQQMNPAHEFSLFNQGGLFFEELKQPAKAVEIWQQYLTRFPNGRNVEAARQLIAQAGTGAAPASASATNAPAVPSATENLILQRVQAGQGQTGKP